jgi:two-component system sensor histidine kinase RegB
MSPPPSTEPLPPSRLALLVNVRWLAAAMQSLAGLWLLLGPGASTPWPPLLFSAGTLIVTNLLLAAVLRRNLRAEAVLLPVVLTLDTLLLTGILFSAGGLQNPFVAFYLLHITLGAMLLSGLGAGLLFTLCVFCLLALHVSPFPLYSAELLASSPGIPLHLWGILLGLLGAGSGILYFIRHLRRDADTHRHQSLALRAEIERREQFNALATFAAGIAHELATPLGTIAVVASDLSHQACNTCHHLDCQNDARLIRDEVARCKDILQRLRATDLLADPLPAETLSPATIRSQLPAHISADHLARVRWTLDPSAPAITTPSLVFFQAVGILVKNACEADPSGQPVDLHIGEDQGQLCVSVRDRGCGIDPALLDKLGQPFHTTKQPGFGTGLGLFLVRSFLDRVRGSWQIDSQPGQGSTFRLLIPARTDA